jgi:hypothetical protein
MTSFHIREMLPGIWAVKKKLEYQTVSNPEAEELASCGHSAEASEMRAL